MKKIKLYLFKILNVKLNVKKYKLIRGTYLTFADDAPVKAKEIYMTLKVDDYQPSRLSPWICCVYNHSQLKGKRDDFQGKCDDFQQLVVSIGCQYKTVTDWDKFFDKKSKEVIQTKRNTVRFYLIRQEYFVFRELIKKEFDTHKMWSK